MHVLKSLVSLVRNQILRTWTFLPRDNKRITYWPHIPTALPTTYRPDHLFHYSPYLSPALEHNSSLYLHLLTEALRLSFADTCWYNADPAKTHVPLKELLSKEYAAKRRELIQLDRYEHCSVIMQVKGSWNDGGNVGNQKKELSPYLSTSLELSLFLTWLKFLPFLPKFYCFDHL